MKDDKFTLAVAEWLYRKTGRTVDPATITFSVVDEGGCETCWTTSAGISYRDSRGYQEYTLDYPDTPGSFVAEVAAIALEAE